MELKVQVEVGGEKRKERKKGRPTDRWVVLTDVNAADVNGKKKRNERFYAFHSNFDHNQTVMIDCQFSFLRLSNLFVTYVNQVNLLVNLL